MKKKSNSSALIVAHRGGAGTKALENTMEAFKKAFEDEADAIEGDFHLTKDGVIVCHHDADIKGSLINENSFVTLKTLKPDLPNLQEVLNLISDEKMIYIEIKCGVEIFPSLITVLKASNLNHSQIVIISFTEAVIQEAKKIFPKIKVYWLCYLKEREIPDIKHCIKVLESAEADGLSTTINAYINEGFIKNLGEQGFSYHAWTVNSLEEAKLLLTWGTASITTDRVEKIRQGI